MNQSGPFKMVVIEPKSLDECRKLVDNLRARKPIIINLERVETDLARKMFDFLGGATYALQGTVQRINPNIYIFAPNNVNIKAMVDRATEAGKPAANANPWK
jgi:cell division inhibitor SepF